MLGRPDREQRLVWGQSAVPAFAGSAAKPLSLLRLRLPYQLRQLRDIRRDPPRFACNAALHCVQEGVMEFAAA